MRGFSKSSTSYKEDHREKVCKQWQEKGWLHMLIRMVDAPVPGKTQRGRKNTRRKDLCKRDIESVELKDYRTMWRNDIHNHSGDPR